MKKIISVLVLSALIFSSLTFFTACSDDEASFADRELSLNTNAPDGGDDFKDSDEWAAEDDSEHWYDSDFYLSNSSPAPPAGGAPSPSTGGPSSPSTGGDNEPSRASTVNISQNLGQRIIHTVTADIDTLEFDESIGSIDRILAETDGFIESSNIRAQTGNRYSHLRRANYVLRIPQQGLEAAVVDLQDIGRVVSISRETENVTSQFTDIESRLTALRLQEERLLYMLSQTTQLSDMISLESRLSDVRFEIERYASRLLNLDARVSFATLRITLTEVEEIEEEEPEVEPTYWQLVREDFTDTIAEIGAFFGGILRAIVASSPVVVPLAILVLMLVLVVRRAFKNRKKSKDK